MTQDLSSTPAMTPRSLALCLVAALGLMSCEQDQGPGPLTGYIDSEWVYVAAPSSGWLVSTAVREGDTVVPGDPLFELDQDLQQHLLVQATEQLRESDARARDLATGARREEIERLESDLLEAQSAARLAASEEARWSKLVDQGIAPLDRQDRVAADLEAALARVSALEAAVAVARLPGRDAARDAASAQRGAAEAGLDQAQWQLEQRRISSRTAGRVERVLQRVGEYVSAGSPVVAVQPEHGLEVRFFVPQGRLTDLSPGDTVDVWADAAEPVEATVSFIADRAEFTPPVIYSADSRAKLVFLVKARLPRSIRLRPGLPVDVQLR